jgi:hypothetical protein
MNNSSTSHEIYCLCNNSRVMSRGTSDVRRRRLFTSRQIEGGPTVWSAWSFSSRHIRNSGRALRSDATLQDRPTDRSRAGTLRRSLAVTVAAGIAFASLAAIGLSTATVASATNSGPPAVAQCNPPEFPTPAADQVTCVVTVVNNVSSSGATSSTITTTACLAAAGVPFPSCPLSVGPVSSTTTSTQLVTSVNQCNGIVFGGGSNTYCNVNVINNVPVGTAAPGVSVDQCVGSAGGGGGGGSTQICDPTSSTTSATVTQCNGSGYGGGTYAGETTVACTVTGGTSALPVTVNQCNGTGYGGGSAITCMSTFTNNFIPAAGSSSPTSPSGAGSTGTTAASGAGGATPGSGVTGRTGSAAGAGGSTGTGTATGLGTTGIVPTGAPQTGFGGASRSRDDALSYAGVLVLIGAALASALAIRRRRTSVSPGAHETS